jgi:hypothetical protein
VETSWAGASCREADGGGPWSYGDVNCSAAARAVTFFYAGFVRGSWRTFVHLGIDRSYAKLPSHRRLPSAQVASVLTWCGNVSKASGNLNG